ITFVSNTVLLCYIYCFQSSNNLLSLPTRRSSDLSRTRFTRRRRSARTARRNTPRHSRWSRELHADDDASHHGVARSGSDLRHPRSEEHTSELQSRENLVCRLLLEKKKKN